MQKYWQRSALSLGLTTALAVSAFGAMGSAYAASVESAPLGKGTVEVKTFDTGLKIHAFLTNDPMADAAYVVETKEDLIGFEAPAFAGDFPVWKDYIAKLQKPLKAVFISNHPSEGGNWYGEAEVVSTERARTAMASGSTKAIAQGLVPVFGKDFDATFAEIDRTVPEGATTMAGVSFELRPDGDGFVVVFPKEKAAILHMLGADCHSIVPGAAAADGMIAVLKDLQATGVTTIYTTHHAPEGADAIPVKIRYLEDVKRIGSEAKSAEAFKAEVVKAWPDLAAPAYLDMTAGAFFPAK